MANVQPPSLAAAVSNAGALGTIAGAALSAGRAARGDPRGARARRAAPFGVNLFAPPYVREDALAGRARGAAGGVQLHVRARRPGSRCSERGIAVLGTATTAEEARVLESAGVDAVVAQGAEAGGHRGTFLGSFEDGLVPLAELLASIDVAVPVVAAGGIVDGADIAARARARRAGVQLGTAFLFTPECGGRASISTRSAPTRRS